MRLSEKNMVAAVHTTSDEDSIEEDSESRLNNNIQYTIRNGNRRFPQNNGNEDYDTAVVVRSSVKPNRSSPAYDATNGFNATAKDQAGGGDTSIEAGCEILCLKFLSCSDGKSPIPRGKYVK